MDTTKILQTTTQTQEQDIISGPDAPRQSLQETALDYASEGIAVIPLLENKAPLFDSTVFPYLYDQMTNDLINTYFPKAKKIGIACGIASGGIECMDFDCHNGENINEVFDKFANTPEVQSILFRNDLPVFRTPSGGYHLLYRNPDQHTPGQKLALWNTGGIKIETRGHGQYIACFPSPGYKQLRGVELICTPEITVEERDMLYHYAEKLTDIQIQQSSKAKGGNGVWPDKFNVDIPAGYYSENEPDHALELLEKAGWVLEHTRKDGVQYWRRPSKEKGTSATFGKLHNMFYVFSADESCKPFEQERAYTPFDILYRLQFNGNKKDAELWLQDRYNMSPVQPELPQKLDTGLFLCRPVTDWINEAKALDVPPQLFFEFWYAKELTILFASAGVGKTILAYQIADNLSKNGYKVLYIDFELSPLQVLLRYSVLRDKKYENPYEWSENFLRAEINPDADIPDNVKFEDYIMQRIEAYVKQTGATVLVVDNITFFRDEQEKAKDALKLMKQLNTLKRNLNLSILVLAHTPKRDNTRPITRNDISGSSMIINYADSAFGIGESTQGSDVRYLKQVKPGRYGAMVYDANNIAVYRIAKPFNFTHYEFIDFGREADHLRIISETSERNEVIGQLHQSGKSLRQIAQEVGISQTGVSKILKKITDEK